MDFTDDRVVSLLGWNAGPTISVKDVSNSEWPSLRITQYNVDYNRSLGWDSEPSVEITDQEAKWLIGVLSTWLQEQELVKSVTSIQ